MSHKLYLTQLGQRKLAELATVGTGQALRLTDFAVGSGRDVDFSKRLDRQTLVSKKYQAHVQDVVNIAPNQYEISCVIPAEVGGFTIREVGLFADNILMWVGSLPEVQKPTLESLSAVDYRIKCIVTIDNTDVRLVVDGNVVTATKKWVLDTIGDNLQAEITKILAEIETLKNRPIIPVGGLFATTKHYANGEAVTADLGYGKWQRALIGRTGVGFDPNASDWTGTMGQKYGANEHTLTIAEIPEHKHSQNDVFTMLGAKASSSNHITTAGSTDRNNPHSEYGIGNMSNTDWNNAKERTVGENQPHNNVQKSEVIAYWERMPDNFVFVDIPSGTGVVSRPVEKPVYHVYWTSDAQGNQKITELETGQGAYLWVDFKNLTQPVAVSFITKATNTEFVGGEINLPNNLNNGQTKIATFPSINVSQDTIIKLGISLIDDNNKEILANLLVRSVSTSPSKNIDWDVERTINVATNHISSITDLKKGDYKNILKEPTPYYNNTTLTNIAGQVSIDDNGCFYGNIFNLDYSDYRSNLELNLFAKYQADEMVNISIFHDYAKQYQSFHEFAIFDQQGNDLSEHFDKRYVETIPLAQRKAFFVIPTPNGSIKKGHEALGNTRRLRDEFPTRHSLSFYINPVKLQELGINQNQSFTIKIRNNDPWWRTLRGI